MPDRRHLLLQAKDGTEMNDWIACINYASAFKTAGVRMRSLGLSGKDIELTGQAAAASHLRDIDRPVSSPLIRTWDGRGRSTEELDQFPREWQQIPDSLSTSDSASEGPLTPPMENPSRLFKATFDQVKADLAAGRWQALDAVSIRSSNRPRAYSLDSVIQNPSASTAHNTASNDGDCRRVSSRSRIIQRKVRDLEDRLSLQKAQLDSDMRFVRNVAILTPFQRATRDRLQAAIQNVAKRIMHVRLDVEKLTCHRDVLLRDLVAEEREWQRTKKIALRAATQKIELERKRSIPRMTISMHTDGAARDPSLSVHPTSASHSASVESSRPNSVATGSFYSALEFTPDSAPQAEPDDRHLNASLSLDFTASTSFTDSLISVASATNSPHPPAATIRTDTERSSLMTEEYSSASHDQLYGVSESPEEQAEEWNKTRAAKRVSLVRVPSTLRMSVFSGRHVRDIELMMSEDSGTTVTPSRFYRTDSVSSRNVETT